MAELGKYLTAALGAGALMLPAAAAANSSTATSANDSDSSAGVASAAPGSDNRVKQMLAGDSEPQPRPESHVTLYTGYFRVNSGFSNRFVTGSFVDLYPGETGLHADLVYVDREENGAYGALGMSHRIGGLGRLKLMVGTSTGDQNILPDLTLHAGLETKPAEGLIVRPSVTYRHFRHGGSHIEPSAQLAYYFGGGSGGYYVAQADGGLTFTNSGKTGWSLSGGLTSVRSNGLRIGFAARTGHMAYDTLFGAEVRSSFWGGGPNLGYRFLSGHELFVRADFTRNEHYSVTGALVGLKLPL